MGDISGPGSNLVLVARRSGHVDITIEAVEGSNNLDARFSLDLLAAAQSPSRSLATNDVAVRSQAAKSPVRDRNDAGSPVIALAGHVSRRGDIAADDAGWLAGPQAPAPIEGVEVRCLGGNVNVAAQFTNTLDSDRWSAWQTPGSLIGTRQKASSLTGLRLRLVGADVSRFEIEGEALFLGSPVMVQRGAEIELVSQAGMDPLVGLKLSIVERSKTEIEMQAPKFSRVRVFR